MIDSTTRQPWTDARAALIRKHWAAGLSASQIAEKIGGTTRNAVIGKLHRLGLARKKMPGYGRGKIRDTTRRAMGAIAVRVGMTEKSVFGRIISATDMRKRAEPRPPAEIRAEAARNAKRVTFADLEDCHCRYPLWETDDDPRHYCGADKLGSLPYCESHSRLCFQLPEPKRKPAQPVTVPAERELETA